MYRKAGTALAVIAAISTFPGYNREAYALNLFGWNLFGSKNEEPQVLNPVAYDFALDTTSADSALSKKLENSTLLNTEKSKVASGDLGLVIKARDDRDRLIAALYENAHYGGIVKATVAGQDIDKLPANPMFDKSHPVPVSFTVEPGPKFTIGKVTLEGDLQNHSLDQYGLKAGGDASSTNIIRAGEKLINELKKEGRPLAKLTKREAIADHKTNTVDIAMAAIGGPIAPVGSVGVSGEDTVDGDFIRRYSRLNGGEPYSPEKLIKASERLRKLGVFSSVTIKEANELSSDGSLPLTIEVSESKHRYLGVGAQYSTMDGAGLQGYWGHRNLFGKAESLRIEAAVNRIGDSKTLGDMDYNAGISFSKPGVYTPATAFNASLKAKSENPDTYNAKSVILYTGLSHEINDHDKASLGLELEYTATEDAFGKSEYLTSSIPIDYVRDMSNNTLNPTKGYRLGLSAKPSFEVNHGSFFASVEGTASAYHAIDQNERVVLAGKISGGALFGASDLQDIPVTRRFFAGGGGSVRGYSYQEISPYNAAGKATGGASYIVSSLEARINVTETIGIVPFIDAGTVSKDLSPDFSDIRAGAGIGLRYATPFGPLRLDVAVPLNRYQGGSKYGIYAGIGQAF